MNKVGSKIRKYREEMGVTQESMAHEMEISQSNYGRLEKDDNRLNVPKLTKIAEVLNLSVSILFDEKASNIIHENHGDLAQNGTIIQHDKEHINSLKDEIIFLRKMLEEKSK